MYASNTKISIQVKEKACEWTQNKFILWLNISCSHAGPLAVTVTSDSTRYFEKQKQIKSQSQTEKTFKISRALQLSWKIIFQKKYSHRFKKDTHNIYKKIFN